VRPTTSWTSINAPAPRGLNWAVGGTCAPRYGAFPGQAASIACREGFGFASRKFRHSPACSPERKKRLPPVALSRMTIPCPDVRLIRTSPTQGSSRTVGDVPIPSCIVDDVEGRDVSVASVIVDEVEAGADDSLLLPKQPAATQIEKIATTADKVDFSAARVTRSLAFGPSRWYSGLNGAGHALSLPIRPRVWSVQAGEELAP
jgi:hypothetical protein